MLSKPLAFALLVAACIVAAAGGAYIATRQNAALAPLAAPPQVPGEAARVSSGAGAGESVSSAIPAGTANAAAARPAQAADPAKSVSAKVPKTQRSLATGRSQATSAPRMEAQVPAARQDEPRQEPVGVGQPKSWPNSGGGTAVAQYVPATPQTPVTLPPPVESTPVREVQDPPPPGKQFENLIVPVDSVLGLQLETSVNSQRAQVKDQVAAKVTRDVRVGNRVAIPAGAQVIGSIVQVGRGGKVKERAHVAIKFHTVVLADSTRLEISTDPIYRESESPASKSAAKIGGAAVGGAILGALIGGGKGAAIGSSIGAAGGTTAVMAGDRATVTLPAGTLLTVRMLSPVTVTVEK